MKTTPPSSHYPPVQIQYPHTLYKRQNLADHIVEARKTYDEEHRQTQPDHAVITAAELRSRKEDGCVYEKPIYDKRTDKSTRKGLDMQAEAIKQAEMTFDQGHQQPLRIESVFLSVPF